MYHGRGEESGFLFFLGIEWEVWLLVDEGTFGQI